MTEVEGFYRWRPAAMIKAEGEDAFSFLQGQFTNDLRALEHAPAVYGLWLTQKGKVLADSFVVRAGPSGPIYLCSYFSPAPIILGRLEAYVVADDLVLTDETPQWYGVTRVGPRATENATVVPHGTDDVVFPGRRGFASAVEWLRRKADISSPLGDELSNDLITHARIAAAIPAVPADLGPSDLPNEGGLEVDAVSYTKGCYLGQEVMARLKTMGQVRRRLVRVKGGGLPPATPATLYQAGKKVGELRSTAALDAGFIGLALVTTMLLNRAASLSLAPDGPGLVQLDETA